MIVMFGRLMSIMVMSAILLHLVWAATIVVDRSAVGATAVNALYRFVPDAFLLAWLLLVVAGMAASAMLLSSPAAMVMLLPQQAVLMMSAGGAVEAMWLGQFADGVSRPLGFLVADQIYCVIVAMGHTAALVSIALRRSA